MWQGRRAMVLGVIQSALFYLNSWPCRGTSPQHPLWAIAFYLEELPEPAGGFDTVFSMGVDHSPNHRRSSVQTQGLPAARQENW